MVFFTPEELEDLRKADTEVDENFLESQEEIELSRKRDRDAKLSAMANKEKIAEYQRAYYEANKEKIAEYQRAYYKANREPLNAYLRNYRAMRRAKEPLNDNINDVEGGVPHAGH